MDKLKISNSSYNYCFENALSEDTYVLSESESCHIWEEVFTNQLKLNVDQIFENKDSINVLLRNWLDSYNDNSNKEVDTILSNIDWDNTDDIYFCISKQLLICTKWAEFKKLWKCFLCIDDDTPFLININNKKFLLCFAPIGSVLKIDYSLHY